MAYFLICQKCDYKNIACWKKWSILCALETYHKSSSPASVCIRASTHIRRLKQNERLSFWRGRPPRQRGWAGDGYKAGGAQWAQWKRDADGSWPGVWFWTLRFFLVFYCGLFKALSHLYLISVAQWGLSLVRMYFILFIYHSAHWS